MNQNLKPLLESAANWKFFSLLLQYPNAEVIKKAKSLSQEILPSLQPDAQELINLFSSYQEAVYHILLGSAGTVSPYESDYQISGQEGIHDKGAVLGDIAAFYKAFGYDFSIEMKEAPDHAAIELAFLSYLKLRQAYSLNQGKEEIYQLCCDAEKKFLSEHLLAWFPQFLQELSHQSEDHFYQKAASMLQSFLQERETIMGQC